MSLFYSDEQSGKAETGTIQATMQKHHAFICELPTNQSGVLWPMIPRPP